MQKKSLTLTFLLCWFMDITTCSLLIRLSYGPQLLLNQKIRDGKIYARGSADDKGQFYAHVKAFDAMVKNDSLYCNVKFMIEGEEEIGL
jgi:hypothetical protein